MKTRPRKNLPTKGKNPAARRTAEREAAKLWLALPAWERQPKTQQELAAQLGVDGPTISDWKAEPGFMDDVIRLARKWARQFTPDVIGAMVKVAIDPVGGIAKDRKLFLQYIEEWVEKSENVAQPQTIIFERPPNDGKPAPAENPPQAPSG